MTPPSTNYSTLFTTDVALIQQVTGLAHALAGTLRRASIIDLLVRHVRDALEPSEITLALVSQDHEVLGPVHSWPSEAPHHRTLLENGRKAGEPFFEAEGWLLVPFRAKERVTGVMAIRDEPGRYGARDIALLEGFVGLTNVALESVRLLDLHDDARRSWQDVVDAISPALCIVDRESHIRRANRAFADLVDAPPAGLIGRPWTAFVPPEWIAEVQGVLCQQGMRREAELRTGDRSYVVTALPLAAADRAATVLLFDDHTERRRLQDQLIQSEKMSAIGQLIAGIAHDLNNPLASVIGFADFLGEVPNVPPNLREPLTVIQEEAERASGIVKNLLSFARKQEHQRRPTALKPLLDATFTLLRNQLMAQRVDYRIDVEPDLPMPVVDPNQIQQVFVNLITNAAHAITSTQRSGTIIVRARRWLDGIAIDVSDSGPGIPEPLAHQVFEPFFTTKPEGHGTGLGLSISQGIVREHGGRILLCTETGNGCTFTVQLPLGAQTATLPPNSGDPLPPRRLQVLVVDDEPHILHYMRATLEAWGHTVHVASDGQDALALMNATIDLVISDLRMPHVGGREFYEALKRHDPALAERVVFSTGDTVRGDTLLFLENLGRPYLHKPFSLDELRALLTTAAQ